MESYFLCSLGLWNMLGSIGLYLMLNEAIADQILRKWTEMIAYSYNVGNYGSMWLLWAATTNMFFAAVNVFAATWEHNAKTVVIYGDLFVYGILLFPAIAALKNENYNKGLFIYVLLSIFWIFWALYLLFTGHRHGCA